MWRFCTPCVRYWLHPTHSRHDSLLCHASTRRCGHIVMILLERRLLRTLLESVTGVHETLRNGQTPRRGQLRVRSRVNLRSVSPRCRTKFATRTFHCKASSRTSADSLQRSNPRCAVGCDVSSVFMHIAASVNQCCIANSHTTNPPSVVDSPSQTSQS